MNSIDLIRMGFRNLHRRKMRTFLTVLGVIIGTAAIVVMMSLGIGMNENFERELRRMGSLNIIDVNRYYVPENSKGAVEQVTLDDKAIAQMAKIEGVEAVTPIVDVFLKMVSGKYLGYTQVKGIDTKTMEAFDFKVEQGRLIQEDDELAVVFGCDVANDFYNPKARGGWYFISRDDRTALVDPMTDKISLTFDTNYGERRPAGIGSESSSQKQAKLYKVKVVGVLAQSNDEKDYSVYMDINQLKKLVRDAKRTSRSGNGEISFYVPDLEQGYERVKVKVKNINDVDRIQEQIKNMGFGTYSLSDIRKSYQKQAGTTQAILGGIGAISLLVAALGISNTMVMSIYERTREIGIMKVLGCLIRDIKRLFLFEAGMIGLLGGITGIVLSYGASFLLNYFGGNFMGNLGYYMGMYGEEKVKISIIPIWLALASIGFATVIGLVCGLYPARRAMKLSALEAIKTE